MARAWQAWEAERAGQHADQHADQHAGRHADRHADPAPADPATTPEADTALVHRCRVMAHYLRHGCWLQAPDLPARLNDWLGQAGPATCHLESPAAPGLTVEFARL